MTDFDYENLQKKRTAQGAHHKKGGSKSRKCNLPHDHYTPAQLQALNSPVTTILLNQPMSWETFKSAAMTDTLRVKYIKHLQDTYHVSLRMLGQMFGVSAGTVKFKLDKLGIKLKGTGGAGKSAAARQAAWEAFCNGVIGGGDNVQPKEEAPAEEPQATVWDVDPEKLADALDEAKRIAEEDEGKDQEPKGFADAVRQHNLNLCDPAHPDHVNARRCEDPEPVEPDPDEELADALLDAFNKSCDPVPDTKVNLHRLPIMKLGEGSITFYEPVSFMRKMESELTGDSRGVAKQVADLLAMFSGKLSVKLSIEVAE